MTLGLGRRARTVEEFEANASALAGAVQSREYHRINPQPGDVYITSWAKSGTTMTQQMFHQLRMIAASGESDMEFDDISRVVPWEDKAALLDMDMNLPQRAAPRGFKSHRDYAHLPSGARYIVTLRDPHETFVSMYRFLDGWHLEKGALSMEEFMPLWLGGVPGGIDYFDHLLSWYARKDEADTLLTTYRWSVKNQPAMIRAMARFLELELDEEGVAAVAQCTSRTFMVEYKDRFDDALISSMLEEKLGIPSASDSTKVQASGSDSKTVPPAVASQIDAMWAERVEPVTGHADFATLSAELDARMA